MGIVSHFYDEQFKMIPLFNVAATLEDEKTVVINSNIFADNSEKREALPQPWWATVTARAPHCFSSGFLLGFIVSARARGQRNFFTIGIVMVMFCKTQ